MCLIQFKMQIEDDRNVNAITADTGRRSFAEQFLDETIKGNPELFLQAVHHVLSKVLAPVYCYQLFYAPALQQGADSDNQQKFLSLRAKSIPINGIEDGSLAAPLILFSFIELFNLGQCIHCIRLYLSRNQASLRTPANLGYDSQQMYMGYSQQQLMMQQQYQQ